MRYYDSPGGNSHIASRMSAALYPFSALEIVHVKIGHYGGRRASEKEAEEALGRTKAIFTEALNVLPGNRRLGSVEMLPEDYTGCWEKWDKIWGHPYEEALTPDVVA
jgi:hypothetical protein